MSGGAVAALDAGFDKTMKKHKETEDRRQESGARIWASGRGLRFGGLLVCVGGWLSTAQAWTVTNINIGGDLNSTAWAKVNNNNNTIVGVLNAQAVSNAWLAGQLGYLATNVVTGVRATNAALPSIAQGTLFLPTNALAGGAAVAWFTNSFTTNYVITNGCAFIPRDVQLQVLCVTNDSTTGWSRNDVISGASMLQCAINTASGGNVGACPVVAWSGTNILTTSGGVYAFVQPYAPMAFPYKNGRGDGVPTSVFNFVMVLRVASQ